LTRPKEEKRGEKKIRVLSEEKGKGGEGREKKKGKLGFLLHFGCLPGS